jgi:hypothetical protein
MTANQFNLTVAAIVNRFPSPLSSQFEDSKSAVHAVLHAWDELIDDATLAELEKDGKFKLTELVLLVEFLYEHKVHTESVSR